jgi:hypothetical protein
MRYLAAVLAALVVAMASVPPAYPERAPGVAILLYPPMDCKTDFDHDFWAEYNLAMAEEWGIESQTMCLERLTEEEQKELQDALLNAGLNVIAMSDDNLVIDGINDRAPGVAQPSVNFGAVEFNYLRTTATLSNETLHLMLEGAGHPRSCYVDAVHDNAYHFARYYDNNITIIKHFDY